MSIQLTLAAAAVAICGSGFIASKMVQGGIYLINKTNYKISEKAAKTAEKIAFAVGAVMGLVGFFVGLTKTHTDMKFIGQLKEQLEDTQAETRMLLLDLEVLKFLPDKSFIYNQEKYGDNMFVKGCLARLGLIPRFL